MPDETSVVSVLSCLLTSLIISMSSASVGFCPRERITVPSSLVVMVPDRWMDGFIHSFD